MPVWEFWLALNYSVLKLLVQTPPSLHLTLNIKCLGVGELPTPTSVLNEQFLLQGAYIMPVRFVFIPGGLFSCLRDPKELVSSSQACQRLVWLVWLG